MMESEHVDQLAGLADHVLRPAAVAPGDQLDRRVDAAHRPRERDRLRDRLGLVEARLVVRRFVADLPLTDRPRGGVAVGGAFGVRGGVAIAHPVGGFLCVALTVLAANGRALRRARGGQYVWISVVA